MRDSNVVECPLAVAWCGRPSDNAQRANEGGRGTEVKARVAMSFWR